MKICLLTEGSYPYVVGGVSSWVQMLMTGLPEFEFTVYAVGAEEKDRGKFKYTLPNNCTEIQEEFLDKILALRSPGMQENILNNQQRQVLLELVRGDSPIDMAGLVDIFRSCTWKNPLDIFMSSDFSRSFAVYTGNAMIICRLLIFFGHCVLCCCHYSILCNGICQKQISIIV